MPRGGHSRSGPPPQPDSFRSGTGTNGNAWIPLTVPTEPTPAWPLGTPTEQEAALWADLWSRPPASVWPRFHLTRDVATYVRTLLAFEHGGHSNAALGALVLRLADQLGLTVSGAHPTKWTYPDPQRTRPASVTALPGGRGRSTAKDRWRQLSAAQPADDDKPPF